MSEEQAPKKKIYKRWWFWVIAFLVVCVLAAAGSNKTGKTTARSEDDQMVASAEAARDIPDLNAWEIHAKWKNNKVKFKDDLAGETVIVRGVVKRINEAPWGGGYDIVVEAGKHFATVTCRTEDKEYVKGLGQNSFVNLMGKVSKSSTAFGPLIIACHSIDE